MSALPETQNTSRTLLDESERKKKNQKRTIALDFVESDGRETVSTPALTATESVSSTGNCPLVVPPIYYVLSVSWFFLALKDQMTFEHLTPGEMCVLRRIGAIKWFHVLLAVPLSRSHSPPSSELASELRTIPGDLNHIRHFLRGLFEDVQAEYSAYIVNVLVC